MLKNITITIKIWILYIVVVYIALYVQIILRYGCLCVDIEADVCSVWFLHHRNLSLSLSPSIFPWNVISKLIENFVNFKCHVYGDLWCSIRAWTRHLWGNPFGVSKVTIKYFTSYLFELYVSGKFFILFSRVLLPVSAPNHVETNTMAAIHCTVNTYAIYADAYIISIRNSNHMCTAVVCIQLLVVW